MRRGVVLLRLWLGLSFRTAPVLAGTRALVSVVAAVLGPLATLGTGAVVDGLTRGDDGRTRWGLALVAAFLLARVLDGFVAWTVGATLEDLSERDVRARVLRLIAGIPGLAHHHVPDLADTVSAVREDSRRLGGASRVIPWMLASVASAVTVTAVLASVAWWLVLLVPAAFWPTWVAGRTARRLWRTEHDNEWSRRRADRLLDIGISPDHGEEVRCSAAGPAVVTALSDALLVRRHRVAAAGRAGVRLLVMARLGFVAALAVAVAALFMAVRAGEVPVGGLVVLVLLLPQLLGTTDSLSGVVGTAVETSKRVGRLHDLQVYASDHGWSTSVQPPPAAFRDGIRFEDVSFTYPGADEPALREVSLHLPAGTTVSLVGENGAGKTTLVALLARLWDPDSGRVVVEGTDLRDVDPVAWRSRATAAFQDHADLQFLVRESVGVSRPGADDDDLWASLRSSTADHVVGGLRGGLEAQLGRQFDGGTDLSGGQWQRLAIARGLLRDAPLLVLLDEPTSALDPEAEAAILTATMRRAREAARRTGGITVVVSHRMSTVRAADLVVVLHDGTVVEVGPHDELVARGGRYAELFALQASGYR
ncbi:ABC transporter ATP-binding protein [Oryzobacter telluris]|uniref:ABC transporter ATP-binding protein n=1 Tax=Oryzobacter telluris TaxID=3149179 RepID=UPI00370D21CD